MSIIDIRNLFAKESSVKQVFPQRYYYGNQMTSSGVGQGGLKTAPTISIVGCGYAVFKFFSIPTIVQTFFPQSFENLTLNF